MNIILLYKIYIHFMTLFVHVTKAKILKYFGHAGLHETFNMKTLLHFAVGAWFWVRSGNVTCIFMMMQAFDGWDWDKTQAERCHKKRLRVHGDFRTNRETIPLHDIVDDNLLRFIFFVSLFHFCMYRIKRTYLFDTKKKTVKCVDCFCGTSNKKV